MNIEMGHRSAQRIKGIRRTPPRKADDTEYPGWLPAVAANNQGPLLRLLNALNHRLQMLVHDPALLTTSGYTVILKTVMAAQSTGPYPGDWTTA
jgi:hypothetical protein